MKRVIRDLVDTLLAILVMCAIITPLLIGISIDINKARTKNAARQQIELCECVDVERVDTTTLIYTNNR